MMFMSIIQTTKDLRKAQAIQAALNNAKACERFYWQQAPMSAENKAMFGHYYREAGRIALRILDMRAQGDLTQAAMKSLRED